MAWRTAAMLPWMAAAKYPLDTRSTATHSTSAVFIMASIPAVSPTTPRVSNRPMARSDGMGGLLSVQQPRVAGDGRHRPARAGEDDRLDLAPGDRLVGHAAPPSGALRCRPAR